MLSTEIKSKINKLWDKFWARGIANPLVAIEQISYLLFMRRLEEIDNRKILEKKKTKERYISIIAGKQEYKWSEFKKLKPLAMLTLVSKKVFPFIKKLNTQDQAFARQMLNAVFVISNPLLLKEAIDAIDEIYDEILKQQDAGQSFQDTQGDMYEYLLSATNQAGKNGQFRTPRHIIQVISELIDPDWNDKICDLTSGTGGFLLGAYQHILTKNTSKKYLQVDENGFSRGILGDKITGNAIWTKLKENTFFGFDNDQSMVRIGLMNLMLHGISTPRIEEMDTLSSQYDKFETDEEYTVIMANPPFKGLVDKTGKSKRLRVDTNQSELLFIDRIIHMLKGGGKAALIIPEGVLYGGGKAYLQTRELLLKDCNLNAVISLPSGVFRPYTNVKTAILLFTKKKLNSPKFNTQQVWFYDLRSDGYSLDDNRKRLNDYPLPLLVKDWENKPLANNKNKKARHFYVSLKDIQENAFDLSINRYKEFEYDDKEYVPPQDLLTTVLEYEEKIIGELKELADLIKK